MLTFNTLSNYCYELLTLYKCYLSYTHEYGSSQHCVLTKLSCGFHGKLYGKESFATIYVEFRDAGQILKIRDCPGDSSFNTVGAYVS